MSHYLKRNRGKNKGQQHVANKYTHGDNASHQPKKKQKQQATQLAQHILAAYYNDARLNILACLNAIREKIGKKPVENEDQIRSAFSDLKLSSSTPERQDELIKHLRYRFPFLDLLTDAGKHASQKNRQDDATPLPQYYESHLNWMLEMINGLRNTMAHPVDAEITLSFATHKKLFHALRKIYDSSFHTVKTRFGHETSTMTPFQRCGAKGKPKKPQQFSLALCLDIEDLDSDGDLPQSKIFYDFGHVLFCSLFLEKSQSAELINYFWQLQHRQHWDTAQQSIAREMIAVYRLRLPIQRLKSDSTDTSVTMDTLSELSRCPRTLLDTLSPEDQNHFRGEPGVIPEGSDNKEASEALQKDTFLFARSRQDRFIPLMMRFFDFNANNRIRFAVDLGQFYYNVRLKPASQFTDGQPRVRRLSQKLIGYGKLNDFEQAEKPDDWLTLESNYTAARDDEDELLNNAGQDIQQLKPYIVQTYPHYHYFDDKIGFRLDHRDGTVATYPDLQASAADQTVALNSPKGEDMLPEFWMSQAQMLQLAFYSHLQTDNDRYQPLHLLLNKYRAGIKKLFGVLRSGDVAFDSAPNSNARRDDAQQWVNAQFDNQDGNAYHVPLSALPKVVVRYLLGGADQQVAVADVIERAEHILKRSEARKSRLRQQLQMADKKRSQKGFRAIKCGPLGDFIAEDLMRFQPVDGNRSDGGKINSQQYQILQKVLAYYGAHIEGKEPPNIVDLLRDANLLSGAFAHPFIGTLNLENQPHKYQGLISFYEAYLDARINYLKQFIKEHRNRDTIEFLPHWLRMRQPSTLGSWLAEQVRDDGSLTQPIPLANNMLYAPTLQMVAEALDISPTVIEQEGMQRFERDGETIEIRPAVTWLMKRYLHGKNDSPQRMYSAYPRRYNVFDTWLDERKNRFKEKAPQYLSSDKRHELAQTIQAFVDQHHPTDDQEVERIRQAVAKPNSKAGKRYVNSDVAKAIKLKGQLRGFKRDERNIRFSISQDILLFMAAARYLESLQLSNKNEQNSAQNTPVWTLHGIEKTLLNTTIEHRLDVPDTDKALEHPACKIRDRGELSLLVRDRRLKSLMPYYSPDERVLHHTEIRYELANYRRAKVAITGMMHELEKRILAVLGAVPRRDEALEKQTKRHFGKGRHGDFLYALHQAYQDDNGSSDSFEPQRFKRTLLIRNAFAHNQYPDVTQFGAVAEAVQREPAPTDNPTLNRKVAERLKQELETLYDPWLQYLAQ